MRFLSLALGGLFFAAALPAHAQTATEPAAAAQPTPKFYVGLGAYHSNYQNLGSWRAGDTGFRVPVQLAVGYQLRPRLALELSAAYSGRTSTNTYDGYLYDATGPVHRYHSTSANTVRITTVSALARYTLTRQPASRLQFDVLGGLGVVHGTSYYRSSTTDDFSGSLASTSYTQHNSGNNWLLTAGLAARYRFNSRFELNLGLATNRDLTYPDFIGSVALGLRYRFGC